jgi:hypothetical protein
MRAGMRQFLYPGGAEEMDVEDLIKIRDRCIEVLKYKKVPQDKTVHYYPDLEASKVSCNAMWVSDTTENNATTVTDYVSCKSCTKTLSFRKAMGEDVTGKERRQVIHFYVDKLDSNYRSWANIACNQMYFYGSNITKSAAVVTCLSCMKTKIYKAAKKRSDGAKKAAETRKNNKVLHSTVDHTGVK